MITVRTTLSVVGAAAAVSLGELSAAHASDNVISAIVICKAIAGDQQRLKCLDEAVASVGAPTPTAETLRQREQALARRELELNRREADLKTKSESRKTRSRSSGSRDRRRMSTRFTTAAASLPRQNVERGTDGAVEAITANVRTWSLDGRGQITVVLDNGQAWRQSDTSALHLSDNTKKLHRVRISRSALGGFTMTVDGKNKAYKVRRVGPSAG